MADELWGSGVRVNTVEPRGGVMTEGASALLGSLPDDQIESLDEPVAVRILPDLTFGSRDCVSCPVRRNQLVDVAIHAGSVDLGEAGGFPHGPLFALELLEYGSGPQRERFVQCPQLVDRSICIRHCLTKQGGVDVALQ